MLQLDSVSFTGVASQPALFNGDFETWQNHTLRRPTSWYYNGDDQGSGLFQTADAYAGNFALELKTYIGDNNGVAQAQPAITSTGYYNCPGGVCNQYGGYPFTNKKDTLAFYYKYAPTISTDSGQVSIAFKKNKVFFSYVGSMLKAAATYQYVEIPFDLPQIPDSVTVQFNSGLFNNTALTYVGADLKVDDVHFKSQSITTGIFDVANGAKINIYPNPGHGLFNIQSDTKISSVEIVNLQGQTVYSAQMDSYKPTVDLSKQPKGSYFYTLRSKNKIISWGKLLVQ